MCKVSKYGSLKEEKNKREPSDKYYILEPFLEDQFEPMKWYHVSTTMDVCTNEIVPTKFCDKEGNDIAPFWMVQSKPPLKHSISGHEDSKHNLSIATNVLLRSNAAHQITWNKGE